MKNITVLAIALLLSGGGCDRPGLGIAAGPGCSTDCDCPNGFGCGDGQCGPVKRQRTCPFICPTNKISFTQDNGCANENGSVAFCIPDGDQVLRSNIQLIAPTVTFKKGMGGAQCHVDSELLCLYPTTYSQCVNPTDHLC